MSEYDFEDEEFEGGNGGEDRLPEPARKRLRELEKELKQLKKDREAEQKALNEFRLRDVLTERGIEDKRISRFLAADGIDLADKSAVDTWLNENGDLFGYQAQEPEVTEEQQAVQNDYQRMQRVESASRQSNGREDELRAKMEKFEDPKELAAFLRANGLS